MTRVAAVLLVLSGCGVLQQPPKGSQEEREMVEKLWQQVYGGYGHAPAVQWQTPDCGDGWGFWEWMHTTKKYECVDGTIINEGLIAIADRPEPMSKLSLAHELGHMFVWRKNGDPDKDHASRVFAPGGAVSLGEKWLDDYEATPR